VEPAPRLGFRFTQLGRGDDPRGLPWVSKAEFDHDEPILAQARTYRERHALENDLEMGQLQPLAEAGKRTPGRKPSLALPVAKGRAGLGGENEDDGSLETKHHDDLVEKQNQNRPGQKPIGCCFSAKKEVMCLSHRG
jgi:hypothetical protein